MKLKMGTIYKFKDVYYFKVDVYQPKFGYRIRYVLCSETFSGGSGWRRCFELEGDSIEVSKLEYMLKVPKELKEVNVELQS